MAATETDKAKTRSFSASPYITAGYVTLFLAFGVFGTWASTAPLASGVIASGAVDVQSSSKSIQHLEGGIISRIAVEEGDIVDVGDVLVELNRTQAQTNFAVLRQKEITLRAAEARLSAENTRQERYVAPFNQTERDNQLIKLAVEVQGTIFNDRRATLEGQIAILNTRIEQFQEGISGLEEQLEAQSEQLASLDAEVTRLEAGLQSGSVPRNVVAEKQRERSNARGARGATKAEIARLKQQISENRLQVVQLRQEYAERAGNELRDIRNELAEVQERINVARDMLQRTTLIAPVRGVVQDIQFNTQGGVVRAAEQIMRVVPLDEDLIINARVDPIDIDNVTSGMTAEVRFPAFTSRNTPAMFGTVNRVSQDVIESSSANEKPYYLAQIEVNEGVIPEELRDRLVPGMPAEVIVATGDRTLVQYLVKPLTDAFYRSLREE
ncbi:MAG: HlyD family type I secretion periplasmic adaptor subunit, partial [Pseudomonadota bacterium]